MAFVFGPLELANSNYSTDDQALFHLMAECKNKLEAYGQAEAAESPAPESYFRQRPAVVVRTTTDGMYITSSYGNQGHTHAPTLRRSISTKLLLLYGGSTFYCTYSICVSEISK